MNNENKSKLKPFLNKIIEGDCLEVMPKIPDKSIDMILADLPYGITRNKWDSIIPLDKLWSEYKRIIKDNGAIVLTATQKFASQLVMFEPELFKYDYVWVKSISSGQLNVNHQPLRSHEIILVFYKKQPTYNPQFTEGKPYSIVRKVTFKGESYNKQKDTSKINNGYRYPTSVLYFSNPRVKGGHPTQKPVELFKYLIKTYTNEGDVVLDNAIGSGTTAIACLETGRNFIGIDISKKYYKMARENIRKYKLQQKEKSI